MSNIIFVLSLALTLSSCGGRNDNAKSNPKANPENQSNSRSDSQTNSSTQGNSDENQTNTEKEKTAASNEQKEQAYASEFSEFEKLYKQFEYLTTQNQYINMHDVTLPLPDYEYTLVSLDLISFDQELLIKDARKERSRDFAINTIELIIDEMTVIVKACNQKLKRIKDQLAQNEIKTVENNDANRLSELNLATLSRSLLAIERITMSELEESKSEVLENYNERMRKVRKKK